MNDLFKFKEGQQALVKKGEHRGQKVKIIETPAAAAIDVFVEYLVGDTTVVIEIQIRNLMILKNGMETI